MANIHVINIIQLICRAQIFIYFEKCYLILIAQIRFRYVYVNIYD